MSVSRNIILGVCFLGWTIARATAAEEKITAEDLLHRHLDSVGTAAVRAMAKSHVVEATAVYRILSGVTATQYSGKAVIVSDGDKMQMLLKINAPEYVGERFKSDGRKTSIEATYANKTRSEFGNLLESDDTPIREGLLGGVLTTAWPLFDLETHKGRLQYHGIKKIDGAELHVVSYQPHHRTGFEITLYFEPGTFRHVRTVYEQERATQISTSPFIDTVAPPSKRDPERLNGPDARSARNAPTRWVIEEQFSDFKTVDGLTLPAHYDLRYQLQVQGGLTRTIQWDVVTTRLLNNIPIDARNFQIQ